MMCRHSSRLFSTAGKKVTFFFALAVDRALEKGGEWRRLTAEILEVEVKG